VTSLVADLLRLGAQGLRLAADLLDRPAAAAAPMPPTTIDPRVTQDGAYCRGLRDRVLWRCLGERLVDIGGGEQQRVGYEDAVAPSEVRWVAPRGEFVRRLQFVVQGDPSNGREVVEAMR
jgi:hypothetical protein